MSELSDVIKKLAVGANNAQQPDKLLLGKVTKVNPIEIQMDDKFILNQSDSMFKIAKLCSERLNDPTYFNVGDMALILRTNSGHDYILIDVIGGV